MKEKWAVGLEGFTKQGNRRRDSHEMVTNWIHETWEKVATPACIIGGFRGYIEWNGDHQMLHSQLHDTILNREVPIELILKVK